MLLLFLLAYSFSSTAQNKEYTQICNEFQFTKTINNKWAAEIWLGNTFSNTPTENNILKTSIQRYFFAWADYHYSSRWKLSGSLAHFDNKDVPDIGQYYSPEWRLTLQGVYYIHKLGYTLSTRMRGELRHIMDADGVYQNKYRYRQQIKYQQPIGSKVLRKGIFYGFGSDEIFLKENANTAGITFFDRNRVELGGGYQLTDDAQIELFYSNEFLPREKGNKIYNAINLTVSFNNLWRNIKKKIETKRAAAQTPD